MDVLKKLLLFDSVQDQICKENIVDTMSPQYKELKGRHTSISIKRDYYQKHLSTLREVQKEGKTWKLLYSVVERDAIDSIDIPTFTIKESERIIRQALMINTRTGANRGNL